MKQLSLILVFCCIVGASNAQRFMWEVGGKLGVSNYLGEIGGDEKTRRDFVWDMKLNQTSFSVGAFARRKMSEIWALNLGFNAGRIKGEDALSSNIGRRGRNLSFRNTLLDLSLRGEVYLYNDPNVGGSGLYKLDFKSYALLGVSGFYHNPQARNMDYNGGAWTNLRPLRTEGQGKEYNKISMSIPMGIGFFFTYKRQHRFGFEMVYHHTFTDYLDDISTVYPDVNAVADPSTYDYFVNRSNEVDPALLPEGGLGNYAPGEQRGLPDHDDVFVFTNFTYSYVFRGSSSFYQQNFGWTRGRRGGSRKKIRAKF